MVPAFLIAAYLIGAIPFGLLLARWVKGVDVREAGSGNIGATNVARSAGKGIGLLTLALDVAKGAAPVLIAERLLDQPQAIVVGAGFAAVLGHVFPVYLRFRGGKGVATSLGVFAAVTPMPTAIAAGIFAVVFAVTRIVSIGSLTGALALIAAVAYFDRRPEAIALAVAVVLLIFVRHAGNIRRIIGRIEPGV